MTNRPYGFEMNIPGIDVDEAVRRVAAALGAEGFGILGTIDVRETLKEKLNVDFRPYLILGACNPALAKQALEAEPQIGLLLPCNVVVQEDPAGGVRVSIADPRVMFTLVDNPAVAGVAEEAERRRRRVIAEVGRDGGSGA
jgi:uncharacterized protein (DUF302 family)